MKKVLFIFFITLTVVLSSCTSHNNGIKNIKEDNTKQTIDISKLTGFSWADFNVETDDPVFMSEYHEIAVSEKGYYFIYSDILYFKDKNSGLCVPVCAKPECSHEDKDLDSCNAYFNSYTFYPQLGLFYYNSNLYILGNDGKGKDGQGEGLYLYKVSMDGTKREMLYSLGEFVSSLDSLNLRFFMHRGKGYLSYSEETKATLLSFEIDSEKPEMKTVDILEGKAPEFYRLSGYGDYVIYQYFFYKDKNLEKFNGGIKVYDGNNQQVIIDNAIKTYCITTDKLYYETNSGIKAYDLKSKKTSDYKTDKNAYAINYDGKYFYTYDNDLDSDYVIYVYNKSGRLIDTIKTFKGCTDIAFGDNKFFFAGNKYFEKSEIGTGNVEWKDIAEKFYNIYSE